jgi:hypothetical protein
MRIPHTATHRGKRVKIVLRDGTEIVDRFIDRTDKWVVLKENGRVNKSDIRAFIVIKNGGK